LGAVVPRSQTTTGAIEALGISDGDTTTPKNRLETATDVIAQSIENHLEYLKESHEQTKALISDHFDSSPTRKAQRDLLTTIPGIASHSAAVLLAEIGTIGAYKNAMSFAAHAGLTPVERSSGSSAPASRARAGVAVCGRCAIGTWQTEAIADG